MTLKPYIFIIYWMGQWKDQFSTINKKMYNLLFLQFVETNMYSVNITGNVIIKYNKVLFF